MFRYGYVHSPGADVSCAVSRLGRNGVDASRTGACSFSAKIDCEWSGDLSIRRPQESQRRPCTAASIPSLQGERLRPHKFLLNCMGTTCDGCGITCLAAGAAPDPTPSA